MEVSEKEVIQKNLTRLIEYTICSETFLSIFSSKNILGREDIEMIRAKGSSHISTPKATIFYSIIETRANAYKVLLEALDKTNQSGALEILKQGTQSPSTSFKTRKLLRFKETPYYMAAFLTQNVKTVMIVSSIDCKITCERIVETTQRAINFTPEAFIDYISSPEGREPTSNVSIVNCGEDIDSIFCYANEFKDKVVLVTSKGIEELKKSYLNSRKNKCLPFLDEDNMQWTDLSPGYRQKLKNVIKRQLQMESKDKCFGENHIDKEILIDIMNDKQIKIFNDTLPEEIKYYIPRRIINRRIVSHEIFKKGGQDIYLFENIERHKLTELAGGHGTEISSTLINSPYKIKCQFVLLEHSYHFEQISEKYDDRPVHVLSYDENTFIWKKSYGSIHNVQTSLTDNQTVNNEDEFMKDIISRHSTERYSICISDTPGMGKSVLLAHFARMLMKEKNDEIVCFVVISEFVKLLKKKLKESLLTKENILSALVKYLAKNKLGEAYFTAHSNKIKELLFDGFDELNSEDVPLGYDVLRIIRSDFKNTRLWVTTRPHMFLELEKVLLVLGSHIQSFSEDDQINFLESFWCRNGARDDTVLNKSNLKNFAKCCISSLKSTVNNKEEDIAGIPLQCMLIGEVFENEAILYCKNEVQPTKISVPEFVPIKSMVDLYERLIVNKIQKFNLRYNVEEIPYAHLIKVHTYLSILLLFPSCRVKFQKVLSPQNFSTAVQQIFDVGILESRSVLPAPRFIHRTFAEYFVAKFIVETLTTDCDETENVLNFLHSHVLKTITCTFRIRKCQFKTRDFKHNVVCYFTDALLGQQNKRIEKVKAPNNETILFRMTEACVNNNFQQMYFNFLHNFVTKDEYKRKVFSESFLKLIVFRSTSSLYEIASQYFGLSNNISIRDIKENNYTLLHLAVIRGNYKLVELLVDRENFKELLLTDDTRFRDLLHECVQDTQHSSAQTIKEKKWITSYFKEINDKLLSYTNNNGELPIECTGISIILVFHLIECGQLVKLDNDGLIRVIHNMAKVMTSEEYLKFLQIVVKDKDEVFRKGVMSSKYRKNTLLKTIFRSMEPETKLMEFLMESGAEYKTKKTLPAIWLATKYQKSENCVKWLLENFEWDFDDIESAITMDRCQPFVIRSLHHSKNIKVLSTPNGLRLVCGQSYLSSEYFELAKSLISRDSEGNFTSEVYKTTIYRLTWEPCKKFSLQVFNLLQAASSYSDGLEDIKIRWFIEKSDPAKLDELKQQFFVHVKEDITRLFSGNTLLHLATATQSLKKIQLAYIWHPDINATNSKQKTPLHWLTRTSPFCFDGWKFFIDKNANICAKDEDNNTPVSNLLNYNDKQCVAAMSYVIEKVDQDELVVKFSGTNFCDEYNNTLLHRAAKYHSSQLIQILLIASYNVNAVNRRLKTPLHVITDVQKATFSLDCWKILVENGADILLLDQYKNTPLCYLRYISNKEVLPVFTYMFTKFPQTCNSTIKNVVWLVIKSFHLDVVKFVCELRQTYSQTPLENETTNITGSLSTYLDAAFQSSNGDVLEFILQNTKCSTALSNSPSQSVFICLKNKDVDIEIRLKFIKVLMQHYSSLDILNAKNEQGLVPLSYYCCDDSFAQLFMELGANVNALDAEDNTPLHCAIKHSMLGPNIKFIEQLIKYGADLNAENKQQETPLLLTSKLFSWSDCSTLTCLLINNSADPSKTDSSGNNFLHLIFLKLRREKEDLSDVLKCIVDHGFLDLLKFRNNAGDTPIELAKKKSFTLSEEVILYLQQYNIEFS